MRRLRKSDFALGAVPLAIIAIAVWCLDRADPNPLPVSGSPLGAPAPPSRTTVVSPQAAAPPRPQVDPARPALRALPPAASLAGTRSPLADALHAPANTGPQDVAIVYGLLEHYREAFGSFPTGEDNASLVNALTGNNPRRLAFLDRSHPAINARGELTDRWQTPLFIHLESRDALEVRSAGPDREMYSADDVLHQSPSLRARLAAPPPAGATTATAD